MPEFDGLAPIGIRIALDIDALDDDAHLIMADAADGMQGELSQLVDAYLADKISGTWAVSMKVSRKVR